MFLLFVHRTEVWRYFIHSFISGMHHYMNTQIKIETECSE